MKRTQLADLNFREVINYGGQPPVQNRYDPPLQCHGYCVSCEETGLLDQTAVHLDLMSHGCDSEDFREVLGPIPGEGASIEVPACCRICPLVIAVVSRAKSVSRIRLLDADTFSWIFDKLLMV